MGLSTGSAQIFQDASMEYIRWKRFMYVSPTGAFHLLKNVGTEETDSGTVSAFTATANACGGNTYTTGNVSGNTAALIGANVHSRNHWLRFNTRIDVTQTTLCRIFIGLTNASAANQLAGDTPSQSYACFRYSTGASDTNWRCMTDSGSGTPNNLNSGIAVSAAGYDLGIFTNPTAGSIIFYINGVAVATSTTTLPATGTLMSFFAGIATLTAATKAITVHYAYGRSRTI